MTHNPKKHAKFFKSILKANDNSSIREILQDATLKNLYAIMLVIRSVLRGEIVVSKAEVRDLNEHKKLLKLARLTW